MSTGDMIQFGALLIAIVSLVIQQTRLLHERRRQELRIETKLRLLYILQNGDLGEEHLITEYGKQQPTETVPKAEIRKALYEMLADETVYFQQNKTYRAHWRHLKIS